MKYHVNYTNTFTEDLDRQLAYFLGEQVAVTTIENWFSQLYEKISQLDQWPKRFPIDEEQTKETGAETRKLNVENYLIFYQVDDQNKQVQVIAFMHGSLRKEANN